MRETERVNCKQRRVEQLEDHLELLKDIIIKQGVRIVTKKQAEEAGLEGAGL